MPEYLAPGVFIEEIPSRLKAIEGVSTSTAAFVGVAERGPVAGFSAPGVPPSPDTAPALVTSFADFVRLFGSPLSLPDPTSTHHLGHAARAFFENGGKRLYVARIVGATATHSQIPIGAGTVLRVARPVDNGHNQIHLNSLRTIDVGSVLHLRNKADPATDITTVEVASYDPQRNSVTLAASVSGLAAPLDPEQIFVRVGDPVPAVGTGPVFFARTPGAWSRRLGVLIRPSERSAIPVRAPGASTGDSELPVQSVSSFYRGAVVEVDTRTERDYHEVTDVLGGGRLQISPPLAADVPDTGFVRVCEIDVLLSDPTATPVVLETFNGLTWNPVASERHYATVINARSRLALVAPPAGESSAIASQPTTATGHVQVPVPADVGNEGGTIGDAEYVGADAGAGARTGIQSLQDIDDVRIVAAPGRSSAVVHNALISQCERMRYRFAVLDGEPNANEVGEILAHRGPYDTSFAAYYTPWVETLVGPTTVALPPSGHVAGIYARTDADAGVHKAPANAPVRGITGLRAYFTTGEQEILNPRGVNAIRRFDRTGIRVWGARTLSSDAEVRYVNVRRFLIFLEASIDRGTQWVVFEPNAPETWSRVTDSVSAFLHTQWRDGALFGRRPEDAFFVRCDETTMSADDILNGRLICHIGVAIVRPAEFVIFRIEQLAGLDTPA